MNIIHSLTEVNRKNFFNIKKTIVKVIKATSAVDINKKKIYIYIYTAFTDHMQSTFIRINQILANRI